MNVKELIESRLDLMKQDINDVKDIVSNYEMGLIDAYTTLNAIKLIIDGMPKRYKEYNDELKRLGISEEFIKGYFFNKYS